MINVVEQFIGISDPDQLPLLDPKKFENMHFHVYWKDVNKIYHGANDQIAIDVGLGCRTKVVGHTDLDFYPSEADNLISNDKKILSSCGPLIFHETATFIDGTIGKAISYKNPWYSSRTKKLLGIMGYSIIYKKISPEEKVKLTIRQLDCLYFLLKGNTFKEIARKMSLSPRTIEHYLETLKSKFGCITRSELIEKAFNLQAIKDRL